MKKAKVCGGAFLLFVSGLVPVGWAAPAKAPPNPQEAGRQAGRVTDEINRATGRLRSGETARAGARDLERLTRSREGQDFAKQARDTKMKADAAASAAKKAKEAAEKCKDENDKARALQLKNEAERKLTDAENAKTRRDQMANDLEKKAKDIVDKDLKDLREKAGNALNDAKAAGLKDTDHSVDSLNKAQQALEKEMQNQQNEGTREKNFEDEGSLSKLDKKKKEFDKALNKVKEDNDPSKSLDDARNLLNEVDELLKNCPPRVGAVPRSQVDVFVAVDNRPWVNVCIPPGKEPEEVINALGFGESQLVTINFSGTMIRVPGDAATIAKIAKEKGIDLCFVEPDYCMIMTPLTPFRGHDHEAHVQSGRGIHDHKGPDPSWDWGITPPETVIRWEER